MAFPLLAALPQALSLAKPLADLAPGAGMIKDLVSKDGKNEGQDTV